MATPVGFYSCTAIWKPTTATREQTVTFGLVNLNLIDIPTPAEVAVKLYNVFTDDPAPGFHGNMIDDYQFLGVSANYGTEDGDIQVQQLGTITGTTTDACVPSNCALLINKNTGAGGRRNRGRFFAPPSYLNEGAVDQSGNIAGGPLATLQAMWTAVMTGLDAEELAMVIFHQGVTELGPTVVESLTVQSQIATQRRRMR